MDAVPSKEAYGNRRAGFADSESPPYQLAPRISFIRPRRDCPDFYSPIQLGAGEGHEPPGSSQISGGFFSCLEPFRRLCGTQIMLPSLLIAVRCPLILAGHPLDNVLKDEKRRNGCGRHKRAIGTGRRDPVQNYPLDFQNPLWFRYMWRVIPHFEVKKRYVVCVLLCRAGVPLISEISCLVVATDTISLTDLIVEQRRLQRKTLSIGYPAGNPCTKTALNLLKPFCGEKKGGRGVVMDFCRYY